MRTPHLLATACPAGDPEARYRHAELAVLDEAAHSVVEYPRPWPSAEEGAMLVGEEVDELWQEVRRNQVGRARAEAVQVAAMALRFIADVCENPGPGALGHRIAPEYQRCFRAAVAQQRQVRGEVGPRRDLVSAHEAFGFLKRENDALWAAVSSGRDARCAAARVAAAAVRFIAEIHTAARPVSAAR